MKTKLSLPFLHKPVITGLRPVATRLLLIIALSPALCALSQIPQGFNYQAIARDGSGNPLVSQSLPARITIQADSLGTAIIWQEVHTTVTSNSFGLINLVLGRGARQAVSTVAIFSDIDWSVTPKFIKTEIFYGGSYKTMGVSRLWSVPYASMAGDLAGAVDKLAVQGKTSGLEEALFEVKNKDGQTVFAVYNEGVRIYVSDGAKAVKGGFAVGGFGTDKAESTKYLFVGKDSVRIYLDTNPLTKGVKSGFAVGGYDLTKGTVQNYLDVSADSVRIYIDSDPSTKKVKGGFVVGGYDMTKGVVQDYLDINSDSVRIYIDSDPSTKKLKGGFAVGGYDMTKGTNTNYMNVNTDASGIINPSQNRVLWFPLNDKNAFLAGKVLINHPDSIGVNSVTTGYESRAKGGYSQAMGYRAIARGDYSTAIGKNAVAGKINSFAFGESAQAANDESYAFGRGAIASGYRSFAFGSAGVDSLGNPTDVAKASGDYSFAIGQGSQSLGIGAFSLGLADTAYGSYSTSIGYKNYAKANYSTAIGINNTVTWLGSTAVGYYNTVKERYSTAVGYFNTVSGFGSNAMGYHSVASGPYSTVFGANNTASGQNSIAMGWCTVAKGHHSISFGGSTIASGGASTAMGEYSEAKGMQSTAMGRSSEAVGYISTSMGYYTKSKPYASLAIGQFNDTTCSSTGNSSWISTDPLFICGKGTADNARSNAFTIYKNGTTEVAGSLRVQGYNSPTTGGAGIEIYYNSGNGYMFCYDRSAGSYKPLYLYTATVRPITDNGYYLGTSSYRWYAVYAANGTIQTSDRRMKENIIPLTGGLKTILNLSPVSFNWKDKSDDTRHIGLIAQEVLPVIPEIVDIGDDPDQTLGINYSGLVPVLVNAIKEQQQQIQSYKSENDNLKSQLQTLQEKVDKIETLLAKALGE